MKRKIFLATCNKGKIQRFKSLLKDVDIYTPEDLNLGDIEVEEKGETLAENAEIKARAYFKKVDMPIISNDTGFWVKGEGLTEAPKRAAFKETSASKEEEGKVILEFWKEIARKHGGKVDAAWVEEFALLDVYGRMHTSQSRREIILTDREFGEAHIQMPVRALYISKTTNKPAILHTKEEEFLEMTPVKHALRDLLKVL